MEYGQITEKKVTELHGWMAALGILESDLKEKFIKGSGSGGQKINKTASAVQLEHSPSGIVIRCQHTRSRAENRFWARRRLCEEIDSRQNGTLSKETLAAEKIRKQKARRKRRSAQ